MLFKNITNPILSLLSPKTLSNLGPSWDPSIINQGRELDGFLWLTQFMVLSQMTSGHSIYEYASDINYAKT